jgi:hypothetical protein
MGSSISFENLFNYSLNEIEKHLNDNKWKIWGDKISQHPNMTFEFVKKYKDNVNWYYISKHPNIKWDDFINNPTLNWNIFSLMKNPNITDEQITEQIKKECDFLKLCHMNIDPYDIKNLFKSFEMK